MVAKIRLFIASAVLGVILCQQADAGAICEAVGKCWDKAAAKISKAHKACEEHAKQKQLRKHKHKQKQKRNKSCGC